MYFIIGQHRRTKENKKYSEHKNLVDCYKELERLRIKYGDSIMFSWRASLKGIVISNA